MLQNSLPRRAASQTFNQILLIKCTKKLTFFSGYVFQTFFLRCLYTYIYIYTNMLERRVSIKARVCAERKKILLIQVVYNFLRLLRVILLFFIYEVHLYITCILYLTFGRAIFIYTCARLKVVVSAALYIFLFSVYFVCRSARPRPLRPQTPRAFVDFFGFKNAPARAHTYRIFIHRTFIL